MAELRTIDGIKTPEPAELHTVDGSLADDLWQFCIPFFHKAGPMAKSS